MTQGQARPPMVFDRAFLTGVEGITELIFVRHGEQHIADPRSGPVGETFDPPLSERGEQQAKVVGERLSVDRIDVVYASPLKRALERIEALRETLKHTGRELGEVTDALKAAEKEQKASAREVESVRATLRSLQKVAL